MAKNAPSPVILTDASGETPGAIMLADGVDLQEIRLLSPSGSVACQFQELKRVSGKLTANGNPWTYTVLATGSGVSLATAKGSALGAVTVEVMMTSAGTLSWDVNASSALAAGTVASYQQIPAVYRFPLSRLAG